MWLVVSVYCVRLLVLIEVKLVCVSMWLVSRVFVGIFIMILVVCSLYLWVSLVKYMVFLMVVIMGVIIYRLVLVCVFVLVSVVSCLCRMFLFVCSVCSLCSLSVGFFLWVLLRNVSGLLVLVFSIWMMIFLLGNVDSSLW